MSEKRFNAVKTNDLKKRNMIRVLCGSDKSYKIPSSTCSNI